MCIDLWPSKSINIKFPFSIEAFIFPSISILHRLYTTARARIPCSTEAFPNWPIYVLVANERMNFLWGTLSHWSRRCCRHCRRRRWHYSSLDVVVALVHVYILYLECTDIVCTVLEMANANWSPLWVSTYVHMYIFRHQVGDFRWKSNIEKKLKWKIK